MEKLIKKLAELYPLKINKSFGKVPGGYLSDNFAVGNNEDKYFLRQYRAKYTKPEIEAIHRIKKFFAKNDVPIILPIPSKSGETFFDFDNRFYALFPFIQEKTRGSSQLTIPTVRSIGKMLAKIHLLSKNGFPNITDDRDRIFNKEKALALGKEIFQIVKNKKVLDKFDKLASKAIPFKLNLIKNNSKTFEDLNLKHDHLIHGDFHELNLFYDEKNEVKYVYDLEKATVAPRSYEIARALDYICLEKFEQRNIKKASEFVKAYKSFYPISDTELRNGLLFRFIDCFHSFWIEKAHYLDNNFRTDVFYPTESRKLKYYSKNLNKILDKILSRGEL